MRSKDDNVFLGSLRRRVLGPINTSSAGVRLTLDRDALLIEPGIRARSMVSLGMAPTWRIAWADVEGAEVSGPQGIRFAVRGRPGFVFLCDRQADLVKRLEKMGVRVDR